MKKLLESIEMFLEEYYFCLRGRNRIRRESAGRTR